MKKQIKAPEKLQLSDKEIANQSDAEFKTLDAQRNDWVWSQNRGKGEGYEKWNKGKCTGNQQEGKETGAQINNLEQKEEINIQPEQNKETRIQKNVERLRNPQGQL